MSRADLKGRKAGKSRRTGKKRQMNAAAAYIRASGQSSERVRERGRERAREKGTNVIIMGHSADSAPDPRSWIVWTIIVGKTEAGERLGRSSRRSAETGKETEPSAAEAGQSGSSLLLLPNYGLRRPVLPTGDGNPFELALRPSSACLAA